MSSHRTMDHRTSGQASPSIGQEANASDARKIVTQYIYPPIPDRQFDWCATFDNYEEGSAIGYGPTKQDAINDLLEIAEHA